VAELEEENTAPPPPPDVAVVVPVQAFHRMMQIHDEPSYVSLYHR